MADNDLPPREGQVLPDDLTRLDADGLGIHVQGFVVGYGLVGELGFALGFELDKDGADLLVVARPPVSLSLVNLGNQSLQLRAAPFDGVDLFANEAQGTEAVVRALLIRDPARSNVARLDIAILGVGGGGAFGLNLSLLLSLGTSLVDELQETDLALFQLHGGFISLLHQVVELVRLAADPDPLDSAEHASDTLLIVVLIRNRREQNGAGRDTFGVVRVDVMCLAQIDVEDALACNHVHEEAIDSPADKGVGVEIVLVNVDVDIAVGQDLELGQVLASGGIDGEQDGPGDEQADEADDEADAQESKEEVGIETLVGENVGVGDLPEGSEPGQPVAWHTWRSLTMGRHRQFWIRQ